MQRIIIVDDEPTIVHIIAQRLRRDGFEVAAAATGEAALALIGELQPAAVLIDVGLPDIDGFEVLRRLRDAGSSLPIIMLTAHSDESDRVVGLELGADDYVVKPFSPRELVARIRALLRRTAAAEALRARFAEPPMLRDLQIDQARRHAHFRGKPLDLRPREFDLLALLATHPGQIWTRSALLRHVWGTDKHIDARTVDVHIRRIRAKLAAIDAAAEPIQTEWGIGYRWIEG
jgi:DNA-binding response OmpR family regulator